MDRVATNTDIDRSAVGSIDSIVNDAGEPFDPWIDDLAFRCDGPCPAP